MSTFVEEEQRGAPAPARRDEGRERGRLRVPTIRAIYVNYYLERILELRNSMSPSCVTRRPESAYVTRVSGARVPAFSNLRIARGVAQHFVHGD